MSVKLIYLSQSAHRLAENQGRIVPAERREFAHLPMSWVEGVPVFDSARMREDEVESVCDRLEQITGRQHAVGIEAQVRLYMESFGWQGVRVKDIMDAVACTKPSALKYLRELVAAGKVHVTEERTHGAAGSPRKRYFWSEGRASAPLSGVQEAEEAGLSLDEVAQRTESGIVHHGSAVFGLVCPCGQCQWAVERLITVEEQSAARREGRNQLAAGVEALRVRRQREIQAMQRGAAAGLAAL